MTDKEKEPTPKKTPPVWEVGRHKVWIEGVLIELNPQLVKREVVIWKN